MANDAATQAKGFIRNSMRSFLWLTSPLVLGTLELIGLALFGAALGRRLLRWLRITIPDVAERGLIATGLGVGALQFLPFVLFATAQGSARMFRLTGAVLALLLIPDARAVLGATWRTLRQLRLPFLWQRLILAAWIGTMLLLFLHALCPAVDGDPLSYHITVAVRYLNAHRFVYLPTLTYTNWPVGAQMLFALLLGLHRDSPVAIVHFLAGLLCFWTVLLFGRRLGGGFAGGVAVVLLMAYTTLVLQMCMAFIDVALTCFTLLAVFMLYLAYQDSEVSFAESGALSEPDKAGEAKHALTPGSASWERLSALFAGLAMTTKLTGLWTIATLLLLMWLLSRRAARASRSSQQAGTPSRAETLGLLARLCRFGAIALLVVTPWLLKSWVLTGNPVYPLLYRVFGGIEWSEAGSRNFTFGHMIWNTPPGMQPTPGVLFYAHLFNAVVGSLVCVATLWGTRRSKVAVPAGAAATFTACICIANYFHPRFLMPALPLVLLCLAYLLRRKEQTLALPLGFLAIVLAISLNSRLFPRLSTTLQVATGLTSRTDYLLASTPDYAVTLKANAIVPPTARILIGTYANNLAYYDAEALWPEWWEQDSIHYESQARLEADLKRIGVDYLVLDPDFPDWCDYSHSCRARKQREPVALTELVQRRGEKLFEANGHTLYRLHWQRVD